MALKSNLDKPVLPTSFLAGMYNSEFKPEDLDLNNFLVETELETQVQTSLETKKNTGESGLIAPAVNPNVPVPLTEQEAAEADRQIDITLDRIQETKNKIKSIRTSIDNLVGPGRSQQGQELSFQMDISRKPSLRRAIKKLFGIDTNTITYSMYQEMLVAKQTLEKEQATAYTNGFPETNQDTKKIKNKDAKQKKSKKKLRNRGFLERNAKQEELNEDTLLEEQYEKLFPKIGRDFVYKEDLYSNIDEILFTLDPNGLNPTAANQRSDAEARKQAREYKSLLDAGKDGSEIYRDLIEFDETQVEEL